MAAAIDHLLLFVPAGFAGRADLQKAGFNIEFQRRHEGLGTAGAGLFFGNLFVEFVWVEEAETSPLKALQRVRFRKTGAAPFGFAGISQPPYSPDLQLPFLSRLQRPQTDVLLNHPNGAKEVRKVLMQGPGFACLAESVSDELFEFIDGDEFYLCIETDGSYDAVEVDDVFLTKSEAE